MSERIEDGGPAFPGVLGNLGHGNQTMALRSDGEPIWTEHNQGLSLRDYFAAKALPYYLQDDISEARASAVLGMTQDEFIDAGFPFDRAAAVMAYRTADQMLKARQ